MTAGELLNSAITQLASELADLQVTTVSGKTYFGNPTKYAGGKWEKAMTAHQTALANLSEALKALTPTIKGNLLVGSILTAV